MCRNLCKPLNSEPLVFYFCNIFKAKHLYSKAAKAHTPKTLFKELYPDKNRPAMTMRKTDSAAIAEPSWKLKLHRLHSTPQPWSRPLGCVVIAQAISADSKPTASRHVATRPQKIVSIKHPSQRSAQITGPFVRQTRPRPSKDTLMARLLSHTRSRLDSKGIAKPRSGAYIGTFIIKILII